MARDACFFFFFFSSFVYASLSLSFRLFSFLFFLAPQVIQE